MNELTYDKARLRRLLLGGVVLTVGCAWLAVAHPPPEHGGRYAPLYDLLGPTGVGLLLAACALFFAAGCVAVAVELTSDGVAARITPAGLLFSDVWGTRTYFWNDVQGYEDRSMRAGRRTMRLLVIHHAPRRLGPFTRRKASLLRDHLLDDEHDVERFVQAACAAAEQARKPPDPTIAPPSNRSFGRRGLVL